MARADEPQDELESLHLLSDRIEDHHAGEDEQCMEERPHEPHS